MKRTTLEEIAKRGDPEALLMLAYSAEINKSDLGTEVLEAWQHAARAGSRLGHFGLALELSKRKDRMDDALRWAEAAAEGGLAEASLFVGLAHEGGLGTLPDISSALKWYERAVAQGSADGYAHIGVLLKSTDERRALEALRMAIEGGVHWARVHLANLLFENKTEWQEALNVLSVGAEHNDPLCLLKLSGVFANGLYQTHKDAKKSKEYLARYSATLHDAQVAF